MTLLHEGEGEAISTETDATIFRVRGFVKR
jgi:hypothetical protein